MKISHACLRDERRGDEQAARVSNSGLGLLQRVRVMVRRIGLDVEGAARRVFFGVVHCSFRLRGGGRKGLRLIC
jgi:hypothetical protein